MGNKTKTIFRWIAVLPASIIGMFIGYVLAILNGNFFGNSTNVISINTIITFVISNAVSGAAFIYAGTYMAPNYKKITAIILTVLFSIFGTISCILELGMNGIGSTFWGIIISFIAAVISCIIICSKENEELEE